MRSLVSVLRYEWRLQWRTLRFRIGALTYLGLSAIPALALAIRNRDLPISPTGGSYLWHTLWVAPFLTLAWSVLIAGNTARVEGESLVLGSAPIGAAGWVMCKWLALFSVAAPISAAAMALPMVVAYLAGAGSLPLASTAWMWVLKILPITAVVTAGWYGLVRITKSEIASFLVAALGGPALVLVLNHILVSVRVRIDISGWSGLAELIRWFRLAYSWRWSWNPASDAPVDPQLALQELASWLALPAGVGLFFLGLAIGHLERARPDSPPQNVRRDHPVRGFLIAFGRFRERFRSDAGLDRWDRMAQSLLLGSALALLLLLVGRAWEWLEVGQERYRTEVVEIRGTTSKAIVARSVEIEGDLSRSGRVELSIRSELANEGAEPVSHLAFELNRHLMLSELELLIDGKLSPRKVTLERNSDRVTLEIDPPLPAGRAAMLSYRLQGRPRRDRLQLLRLQSESFAASFERHLQGEPLSALADSTTVRAASSRWISLRAADVMLAPRWTTWELTPDMGRGQPGRQVPEETHRPALQLGVALTVPGAWVVADSCGGHASHTVLQSRCRLTLPEVMISGGGGRVLVTSPDGRASMASLRGHEELGRDALVSLARVVELSENAWPGLQGLATLVALERPMTPEESRPIWLGRAPGDGSVSGNLIILSESLMRSPEPVPAAPLAASILTRDLRIQRPLDPEERASVEATLRTVLLLRMGLGADSAWVWTQPFYRPYLRVPITRVAAHDPMVWGLRMPAVLRSIEARVGTDALMSGVRRFLDEPGEVSVGLRDLLAAIEVESGVSLEQIYRDFFLEGNLPDLRVLDVESGRAGDRYRVAGRLGNLGTGEARCTLVARSEIQEVEKVVVVGDKQSTPFEMELSSQPHTLSFDPRRECFQLRDPARSVNEINLRAVPAAGERAP